MSGGQLGGRWAHFYMPPGGTILFPMGILSFLFPKLHVRSEVSQRRVPTCSDPGDLSRVRVFGKWHRIPRKQATYGDTGLTYTFSGLTLSPKPWIPVLEHIRDRVAGVTGHTFNFVLVNRYKDGCDHIGEHRDDESELAPRSPIASVSFGACRDFFFRHRDCRGKAPSRHVAVVKIQLAHGSLLMMNSPTNVYWYHSLPVRKRILAPRVNLTFRNILLSDR
ncbi:DNA oxidative demethylase ALKBH2 isoform X2 [Phascolarctos cinereus]